MEIEAIVAHFSKLGGVLPAVGDTFDPLKARDVDRIESHVKHALPPTVRAMLMHFGAFTFEESAYYRPAKAFPKWYSKSNRGIVGNFLGKKSKSHPRARGIDLMDQLSAHKDDFAPPLLPVADNGAGDVILVRVTDSSVQLWIHDAPSGREFHHVNDLFDEWILSLQN